MTLAAAAFVLLLPALVAAQSPERRIALVIGNNAYQSVSKLLNAENDARAVSKELAARGFTVIQGYNLDRGAMLRLVNRFVDSLAQHQVGLFYYAGHGVQMRGANYLVPVNGKPDTESDLADDSVPLEVVASRMARANSAGFNLLIIDACRDNPFRGRERSLGSERGLSPNPANGVMIVHSAGSNQTALDRLGPSDTEPNSIFTRELLKTMREPGLSVRQMVTTLRTAVQRSAATIGHAQMPALYDEAIGDFIFTPAAPTSSDSVSNKQIELEFWRSADGLKTRDAYQAYLDRFPKGDFAELARIGIRPALPSPVSPQEVKPIPPTTEIAAALARIGLLPPALIQYALIGVGKYSGPPDGRFGASTRKAIESWQTDRRLAPSGVLSSEQTVLLVQLASESGHPESQNTLGIMYANGIGVPKDEAKAVGWFTKASDRSPQAKVNLAIMLRDGRGIASNPERARLLLQQAQQQGSAQAGAELASGNVRP